MKLVSPPPQNRLSEFPPTPLMAPALTSNPFHLTTKSYLKSDPKARKPNLVVSAKGANPFGLGKRRSSSTDSKDEESGEEGSKKDNGFPFDFGKFADAKSLIPVVRTPGGSLFSNRRRKEEGTVFVAGATGQVGIRIAQMLLRRGFAVRAGVPDLASAQELARLAATYKIISPSESKRLNAVESAFGDAESIAKAIGPAAKAVVTVGPAENGPSDAVDAANALAVVRAAQLAGVGHVAIVCLSGAVSASTYNVIDGITSFFSNLFARSQPVTIGDLLAELAGIDVGYTLVKADVADDYATEIADAIVLSEEGTTAADASKVSKSQIAALVADVFSNTSIAENKVVEVSTSPSASSKPIVELFSAIPEDGRRKAYAESLAKAKAEEEALAASEKAAEAAKKVEEDMKKLSEQKARGSSLTKEAEETAAAALESLVNNAKNFNGGFSWEKLSSQVSKIAASQKPDDGEKAQIATVRGQAKARNLLPKKAVLKQAAAKPKPEIKSVLGGLFKQETIYIDED